LHQSRLCLSVHHCKASAGLSGVQFSAMWRAAW
jgi:hypothetical protein